MKSFVKVILNFLFCKVFYRVRFHNKEFEENLDKCVICPNHSNTVEPSWIYAKTKNLCIMAKAELFYNNILNKLLSYFDVFPIRRGEHDSRSLIHAINLFKNTDNKKLLVFPEGERVSKKVERGVAKVGPAYIAYKAKVPIVPVYITKNARLFHKVHIIYGEPIYVSENEYKDREKLQKFSNELLDTIYKLKKENRS